MQSILPEVSEACRIISQEESQREVFTGPNDESEGLAMFSKSTTSTVCGACGKTGHTRNKCWTVVGYPPWFNKQIEGKGKEREQQAGQTVSQRGGRGGRFNRGGRQGRGGGRMAANVQSQKEASTSQSIQSSKDTGGTGIGVTAQQMEQLLKLLSTSSKASGGDTDDDMDCNYAGMVVCNQATVSNTSSILDSGATHHITAQYSALENVQELMTKPKIDLPNGASVTVTHQGSVQLNGALKLKNVVYVPAFRHNLISVQKLVKEAGCEVKFKQHCCIIQNSKTKEVVGAGIAQGGLYLLINEPVNNLAERLNQKHWQANVATEEVRDEITLPDTINRKLRPSKQMLWHQRKFIEVDEHVHGHVLEEHDIETNDPEQEGEGEVEEAAGTEIPVTQPVRQSSRPHKAPRWLDDYYTGKANSVKAARV
ncbi:Retrovirus-related Pol polyprotein from transposon RE1, partial [Bienertia sinuspersici]